jgi:hypothetical protein
VVSDGPENSHGGVHEETCLGDLVLEELHHDTAGWAASDRDIKKDLRVGHD